MNVSTLIKQYFTTHSDEVAIDVFDEKNIFTVYQRVIETLTRHMNIETTVLQALSYYFYEILDNAIRGRNLVQLLHITTKKSMF